jgi:hypothetical protein
MLELNNVSLIVIDCIKPEIACQALKYSSNYISFHEKVLFTSHKFVCEDVNVVKIPPITSLSEYSSFCIEKMAGYLTTDFMISIHSDGFIINPHLWTDEFFEYDYIGAPWPPEAPWCKRNRVGNGGFSLRSRKFMEIAAGLGQSFRHEDILLTNICYDTFIAAGCRYAPVELAMKFALEAKIAECEYNLDNCFGFHGKGEAFYHYGEGQQFKDRIALLDTVSCLDNLSYT